MARSRPALRAGPRLSSSVATSIIIYDRLKADDCPASKTVLPKTLRDLSAAADLARGN